MKITKEELKQIIREEAYKFKKKLQLESELAEIESQLNEVEAGSLYDAGESAGKKYKAEFEHLDNEFGIPGETETYMEEVEMEEEAYEDVQNEEDLNLEAILAEIMSEDSNEEVAEECGTYEETYMEESDDNDADDLTNELYKEETLSEGEIKKATILISEQARMKRLAGVISESEEKMLQEITWMQELMGDEILTFGKGLIGMLGTLSLPGLLWFSQWIKTKKEKGVKATKEELDDALKTAKSK